MNDLIIKICGMREQADLDCAAALGVNLCGFIFAPQSPRAVTPEQAAALDSGDMLRVGVFVTDDMRFIEETARAARLDRVQLHGDQSMTCANRLSRTLGAERLIRVLWPERYPDLAALEETIEPARGNSRNVPARRRGCPGAAAENGSAPDGCAACTLPAPGCWQCWRAHA